MHKRTFMAGINKLGTISMKPLFTTILILILSLTKANACTCLGQRKINNEIYKAYEFIAEATVIKIRTIDSLWSTEYTFVVNKGYKGFFSKDTIRVYSGWTSCEASFRKHESYLVYAHRYPDGNYYTELCDGNLPLSTYGWGYNESRLKSDLKFLKRKSFFRRK